MVHLHLALKVALGGGFSNFSCVVGVELSTTPSLRTCSVPASPPGPEIRAVTRQTGLPPQKQKNCNGLLFSHWTEFL